MKKLLSTFVLLACCATGAMGQLLTVSSVERVALPDGAVAADASLSPDGSFVVVSDYLKSGLDRLDLSTGAVKHLSDNGVSLGLKFSADSRQVMFRENSYSSDHLRYVTLRALDMESGESRVIVENTRSLQGIDLQSDMAIAVDNGRLRSRSLTTNSVSATAVAPVVSIDHGQLCITENGATRILSPMGTDGQSYLWPEVSPDGKKIVFYLAATGCFVCNIDGSDCHHIGTIRAARWMGNDMIVGMYDQDNGVNVTASELIASNAAGTVKQTLTDSSVMAMFPSPSVAAGKIAFTTPQGELYIMTVE